ncbi:MAG: hypothetical protein RSE91_00155 [Bacilli bacterium]
MKNKKLNGTTREIVISFGAIALFVISIIGVSFAIFNWQSANQTLNSLSTGTITFIYSEKTNGINITNAQPMTDNAGKNILANDAGNGITNGYFDFSVSGNKTLNTTVNYEIYAVLDSSTNMNSTELNNVKLYLTDTTLSETPVIGFNGAVIPTYGSLPQATSDPNGKRLYTGTFSDNNFSNNYRLRVFIGSGYTTADVAKTFAMYVNVKAIA